MRKASFEKNHSFFAGTLVWYGDLFAKLVDAQRVIKDRIEKLELIEALALRVVTRWENLVEADIIVSLNRDSSAYAAALNLKLRKHLSRDECEAILVGRGYIDFKSAGDIKGFARRHLVNRFNPFEAISSQQAESIDELLCGRNLLAHYSSASWRSYVRFMKAKYDYKRVPEPGVYLASINRRTGQWRFGEHIQNLLRTSRAMINRVDPVAAKRIYRYGM